MLVYGFTHPKGQITQQDNLLSIVREIVKPGDIVEPVTNHTKRTGFVITTGGTRNQAIERAMHVVESIKIKTMPAK